MKDWEEWFKNYGGCALEENQHPFERFTINEMYEMFKARIMDELVSDDMFSQGYGQLIDVTKNQAGGDL